MPFSVKTATQIIQDLIVTTVDTVDTVNDVNPGSVLRVVEEALGQEIADLYTELNDVYEGTRIETATGTDLESLGALVGITRNAGLKATGNVTFIRTQPALSNFTVAAGAIVSTQPNTGEEQLKFSVTTATTFQASITNESHTFVDGIYRYKMDQRFISSISAIDGTLSAAPNTFVATTDYLLVEDVNETVPDPDTVVVIDDCETADFTESTDAIAETLNSSTFREGSNSLNLGKSGTASTSANYEKTLGAPVDISGKNVFVWLRVIDATALAKIAELKLTVGSGGSSANSYTLDVSDQLVAASFELIKFDPTLSTVVRSGNPDLENINYIKIDIVTNATGDTLSLGDVLMDFWFGAESEEYEGDVIDWDQGGDVPDDGTTFDVDYVPLSVEVPVESEAVGAKYNVGRHKIIFKVSNIPNISNVDNYLILTGGADQETDDDYRVRIQAASSLLGKATVEALKQAVLGVNGIISVSVDDTPTKTQESEPHVYDTGVTRYKLNFEVANDDATLLISDSAGGSADYIKDTDYELDTSTSEIVWLGASVPVGGNTFYVDYTYEWLGHVEIFAAGATTPVSSTVSAAVDAAILDTRSAGIVVTWSEPTIVTVAVTTAVTVESGFTASVVRDNVETAILNYLSTIAVGEDVYRAELFRIIQEVAGVENSTIAAPAADVTIASDEVARPGSIVVS